MSFYNAIFEEPNDGTPGAPGVSVDDIVYNDPEDQLEFFLSNGIVKEIPFPGVSLDTTAKINLHGPNDVDKFTVRDADDNVLLRASTTGVFGAPAVLAKQIVIGMPTDMNDPINTFQNGSLTVLGNFTVGSISESRVSVSLDAPVSVYKDFRVANRENPKEPEIEVFNVSNFPGNSGQVTARNLIVNETFESLGTTGYFANNLSIGERLTARFGNFGGPLVSESLQVKDSAENVLFSAMGATIRTYNNILDDEGTATFNGQLDVMADDGSLVMRADISDEIVEPRLIARNLDVGFFDKELGIIGGNILAKGPIRGSGGLNLINDVDNTLLRVTTGAYVETRHNVLDDGAGNSLFQGYMSISGSNNDAKFRVSDNSGTGVLTVDTAASRVLTKNNTLDDGSGAMAVSGNVSITGADNTAKFRVSDSDAVDVFTIDTAASKVLTKNNTLDNGNGFMEIVGGASIGSNLIVGANLTVADVFGGGMDKFVVRGQFNEDILRVSTSYGAPLVSVKNLSITDNVESNINPASDGFQDIGSSSSRWASVYGATGNFSGGVLTNNIHPQTTGPVSIMTNDTEALIFGQIKSGVPTIYASFGKQGGFIPAPSNPNKNIGWVDNRWSNVYCENIDMTGNISMPNVSSKITTPRINGISGSYLFIDAAASQGVALRVNNTGGVVAFETIFRPNSDNTTDLGGTSITWKNIRLNGHILSNVTGLSNIGTSTMPFNDIYAMNPSADTSDANKKNTIVNSDLGLDFIEALRPVSYKMNDGTSGRTHYGLISQEVEEILPDFEKTTQDFAGFIKSPRTDIEGNIITGEFDYALRYGEFIAPMIKAIQELSAQNAALVARIEVLEEQMNEL